MSTESFASELIAGLETFAAELKAGKLDPDRITTYYYLSEPCPACGSKLVGSWRMVSCTGKGCRYSWEPNGEAESTS